MHLYIVCDLQYKPTIWVFACYMEVRFYGVQTLFSTASSPYLNLEISILCHILHVKYLYASNWSHMMFHP